MPRPVLEILKKHWLLIALIWIAAVMLLWGLGGRPLKNWDESIYAQISKEMLQTGDWITPRWNSQPWFEKPPLYIWAAAAFFKVFGVGEFAARLPSALSGVGLVAVVFLLGRRMYSTAVAGLAAVIVLTCFQIVQASRLVLMDVMLTFFIFAAIYFYVRTRDGDARWWYLVATASALAFMTKGFAAIVAPAAIVLALIFDGQLRTTLKEKHFWFAWLLGFGLLAPWHITVYARYRNVFLHEYFGYHVWARGVTAIEGKTHRYLFYLDPFLTFFKPWWALTPFAIVFAARQNMSRKRSSSWVVLVLGVLVFAIFTIARTQMSTYIMPVYPAMAILISALLMALYHLHKYLKPIVIGFAIFGSLFAIGKLSQPYETTDPMDTPIKKLALQARRTSDDDTAPLILFGGLETSRLAAMFYSERPIEQATTLAALAETSRLSRYIDFRQLAEITDASGKRILIKRVDLETLPPVYEVTVIDEADGWLYAWIKKRAPVTMRHGADIRPSL